MSIIKTIQEAWYSIKKGFKNLKTWVPVIWKDRDYDYTNLYKIMYKKLETMETFFNSDNLMGAHAKIRAKEINVAKNLCLRLIKDDYLENALWWHYKKFEHRNIDEWFEDSPDKPGYKVYVSDRNKPRGESFRRACNHSEYMKQQDREMLFNLMSNKIERWWD